MILYMETEPLYWADPYLKNVKTGVINLINDGFATEKTVFYPGGGGQPFDTGYVVVGDVKEVITRTYREGSQIVHVPSRPLDLSVGDEVKLVIDWDRRYRVMRLHTSLHILSAVMYERSGYLITGSQIYEDRARIDFPAEEMNKDVAVEIVEEANRVASRGYKVETFFVTPDQAREMMHLFRVADFKKYEKYMTRPLRVVKIGDIDIQFDGGTHVRDTREIGDIKFLKYESKGRRNRRIYILVEP